MMRGFITVVIGCVALAGVSAPLVAQVPRDDATKIAILAQNPTLAQVDRLDPVGTPNLIERLLAITRRTQKSAERGGTWTTDAEAAEIAANPAIALAYEHDPEATLDLLAAMDDTLRAARLRASRGP